MTASNEICMAAPCYSILPCIECSTLHHLSSPIDNPSVSAEVTSKRKQTSTYIINRVIASSGHVQHLCTFFMSSDAVCVCVCVCKCMNVHNLQCMCEWMCLDTFEYTCRCIWNEYKCTMKISCTGGVLASCEKLNVKHSCAEVLALAEATTWWWNLSFLFH